jgi:hypothetical protein|tara:strand:+ start:172 stop:888 length:717 start_codon:yes stop_codon:yes gene_type:complete
MAEVTIFVDENFTQRSRTGTNWTSAVDGDTVFNGSDTADNPASLGHICSADGGTFFTNDRCYFSFDLSEVPSDGTITGIVMTLHFISIVGSQADSDYLKFKIVKATEHNLTTGNGASTWDDRDESVVHDDDNFVTCTDDQDNSFTFNTGDDLFAYVVAQHAAGNNAAFWPMSKLELEDGSGAAPTGANRTSFAANGASTSSEKPKLVITYTPAVYPNSSIKLTGGSIKLSGGNLKIEG